MAGVRSDQFIYHFDFPGQPIVYLEHSSLIPMDRRCCPPSQVFSLGQALKKIHEFFKPAYGAGSQRLVRPGGGLQVRRPAG